MNIKELESKSEGRTIELEQRFFRVDSEVNEWEYLLGQLGISEEDSYDIDSISIKVDLLTIEENK